MKGKLITLFAAAAIASCAATTASAQGYFGARVSYELACPGDVKFDGAQKYDAFNNGSGIAFEGIYHLPIFSGFFFEPGVAVAYNTYGIDRSVLGIVFPNYYPEPGEPGSENINVDGASARMWDLRIPLHFGYERQLLPALKASVFTGPEFVFGLWSKANVSDGRTNISQGLYGKHGYLNRYDVRWRFGVGVTFLKHYYAAISGAVGICDRFSGNALAGEYHKKGTMRSSTFDITVGYNF